MHTETTHFAIPCVTTEEPGIGGILKTIPSDFVVEEIPLYQPSGEGDHVYVGITRENMTTRALNDSLIRLFGLSKNDVGYAGMKDKQARVTQTFSLMTPRTDREEVARRIDAGLPVAVNWVARHKNKLRVGHLLGNRFHIRVRDPHPEADQRIERIRAALAQKGMPNFFGPQRFGDRGDNPARGMALLSAKHPGNSWLNRLYLSSLQAELFNLWLSERMRREWFDRILVGDIAKKLDTGGLFEVEDLVAERIRFEQNRIAYTGPIYSEPMIRAKGEPGELERLILDGRGITAEQLMRTRLKGDRRPARILLDDIHVERDESGIVFSFHLPKGAYASVLMNEFMKNEAARFAESI